jgi:hypothetical protein
MASVSFSSADIGGGVSAIDETTNYRQLLP